jgi:hypothetical protein
MALEKVAGRQKPKLARRIGDSEPERMLRIPPPRPPHAPARAVQEERTEKRRSSEPERMLRIPPPRPPHAPARAVQEERMEKRRSSEPVLGRSGQGCRTSVLAVAVACQARRGCSLGSARLP